MGALRDLFLVVMVLAGVVLGSQVPRIVQEYEQRLGGARQESSRQLDAFRALAAREGLPFDRYLARLLESPDAPTADIGRTVAEMQRRSAGLERQAELIGNAARLLKPLFVLRHYDPDLLRATWDKYESTLTLDPAFAGIGALLGWLLNSLAWAPFRRPSLA